MSRRYATEKLSQIIHNLTTGEGAIVERLRDAGRPHLALLDENDFPSSVRDTWIEISNLYKEDMVHHNLTEEKANYIANKLLYVQDQVRNAKK